MALLESDLPLTVGFVFSRESADSKNVRVEGTGFYVLAAPPGGKAPVLFVTASHVIEGVEHIVIRGPRRLWDQSGGKPEHVYFQVASPLDDGGPASWYFHPDRRVDLAALPLTEAFRDAIDCRAVPADLFLTPGRIDPLSVGPGDEVFFVGLLANPAYLELRRHEVCVRHGHIAMMPREPVKTKRGPAARVVVECTPYPRNSGSLVFVQLTPDREPGVLSLGGPTLFLLGVMAEILLDRARRDGPLENMGLSEVVPAIKVLELADFVLEGLSPFMGNAESPGS